MKLIRQALMAPALATLVITAHATPIGGVNPAVDPFDVITAPDVLIDFNDYDFATDGPASTAYQAQGVTFDGNLSIGSTQAIYAGFSVQNLYTGGASQAPGSFNSANRFEIQFSSDVVAAAFRLITNPTPSTYIYALDDGAVVDSFVGATDVSNSGQVWWGFDIASGFDTIAIESYGAGGVAHIDDLSFSGLSASSPSVQVSEPGLAALLMLGLAGVGASRRRRSRCSSGGQGDITQG